jgi:hypothetical protein
MIEVRFVSALLYTLTSYKYNICLKVGVYLHMNGFNNKGFNKINGEGFLRGVVFETTDPDGLDRIGVHIPKMMSVYEEKGRKSGGSIGDNMFSIVNKSKGKDELWDDFNQLPVVDANEASDFHWAKASCLIGGLEQKLTPIKGQVIWVYMEEGDPQRLFYLPIAPNLTKEKVDLSNLKKSKDNYKDKVKRERMLALARWSDGNIIGMDYNKEVNSFEIRFKNGHTINIVDNSSESQIEVSTPRLSILLDEKHNKMKIDAQELEMNVKLLRLKGTKVTYF